MAQQFASSWWGGAFHKHLTYRYWGFHGGLVYSIWNRLYFDGTGPAPVAGPTATSITAKLTGQFNNMGIPGAKSFLDNTWLCNFNPYFDVLSKYWTTTVLADGVSQNATFFLLVDWW
jgi:hypothetical protein